MLKIPKSGIIAVSIVMGLSGTASSTIKNHDLCHSGLCLKLYENSKESVVDELVYSNIKGQITYIVRLAHERNLLLIYLSPIRPGNCPLERVGRVQHGTGCFNTADNKSREIHAKYFGSKSDSTIRRLDPTLWVDCDRSVDGCDEQTSAPLPLKILIL